MSDNEFIDICENSPSMMEAAKKINTPYSSFIRKAKKLKCYYPNPEWNKGKTSIDDNRIFSKYNLEDIFCKDSIVARGRLKKLLINLSLVKYICGICGMNPMWNGKSLSLHIDHINGIRNDNRLENVRFLCPNCHSQTETYCSVNKDSKKISSYPIEEILKVVQESNTLTSVIRKLGILDTEVNRIRISKIMENNSLNFLKVHGEKGKEKIKSKNYDSCKRCFNKKDTNKYKFCVNCSKILQRKCPRPTIEVLLKEIEDLGYCATGRKYGVSDNAVRKWIKSYQKKLLI